MSNTPRTPRAIPYIAEESRAIAGRNVQIVRVEYTMDMLTTVEGKPTALALAIDLLTQFHPSHLISGVIMKAEQPTEHPVCSVIDGKVELY